MIEKPPEISRSDLIKLSKEFDSEALPLIDDFYNLAFWLTDSEKTAKKITVEVFNKAIKFCDKTKAGTGWKMWLLRILINHCNEYQLKKEIAEEEYHNSVDKLTVKIENDKIPEEITTRIENITSTENIRPIINFLPYRLRLPLLLKRFFQFSYNELADYIDVPEGTAAVRLFRGRKYLCWKILKTKNQLAAFEETAYPLSHKELKQVAFAVESNFNDEAEHSVQLESIIKNKAFHNEYLLQSTAKTFTDKNLVFFTAPSRVRNQIGRLANKKFR